MQPPPPNNKLNLTTTTLFLILIFSTTTTSSSSSNQIQIQTQIKTHPTDLQSLKSLKSSLNPNHPIPGSCLASWNFSYDPCASSSSDHFTCGIRCDLPNNSSSFSRVIDLSLDPAGYYGTLSSPLNLPFLQTLSLSDNYISGPLPPSIFSNLTRLRKLILSRNSFSGSLPESLSSLTQLQELCLDNNNFQGPIFTNLVKHKLQSLERLELQRNRFTGSFPDLGSLKNLYFLDVSDNQLVGKIESQMLPNSVIELSLRNNSFDSFKFSKLPFLQVLDLSHNALSGSVSADFFTLTSLQQLTLSHNNLSTIEDFNLNFNRSSLVSLDMSHNMLQGPLPEFMARLPALSSLSLEHNMLTGLIPSNYAKRAALESTETETTTFGRLLLGGNYLFGLIPGPLTSLKPGRVNVSLVDNCLYSCPYSFFFCQGGNQKSATDCNRFRHFNINKNKN